MRLVKFGILVLVVVLLLPGCQTYKNIPYFQNLPDTAVISVLNAPYKELIIQPDDILNVSIQTLDPSATLVFNQNVSSAFSLSNTQNSSSAAAGASSQQGFGGYLVGKGGDIELPLIGRIKVAGLTTQQARDSIEARAATFYKLPTVNIRFINFKVNVLGEVLRPGTYILPNEKNTIFDALGLAGDLTVFGKRENALLIRDSAGQSKLIRFSLNDKDLIKKDFFFLKQNDVIYIEPNKSKVASTDAVNNRNFTILASVLSVIVILATRVR